jgi:uncharacterized protein (TIGR03435 family)
MDSGGARVLRELQARGDRALDERLVDSDPAPLFAWRRIAMTSAVAAVLLAVFIGTVVWRQGAPAVVESVDGGLYRVVEGKAQPLRVNERLEMGETIHSNGGSGGTLVLADGSRVEMRSGSELSLEPVDDGVRIRLNNGGVIVNAAKQRKGHLYVQTKDVTVSVVGTVFLVHAEEEGSRVAVIEGEVRVQQGGTEQRLRPGEQMKTNALMESQPVSQEIAWSRSAPAHLALLQQSASPTGTRGGVEPRLAFEETVVRPSNAAQGGGRGGGGGSNGPCSGGYAEVDPRRFAISGTTLYTLITMAHRIDACPNVVSTGRLTGGPTWVGSDPWDIQALIPEGAPHYTRQQFNNGEAPNLQVMFQNLLADRFKLVLRREKKEMSAYVLTVGKDGLKLAPSKDEVASTGMGPRVRNGQASVGLNSNKMSMARLAGLLGAVTGGKAVLDRTNVTGEFNISIGFVPPDLSSPLLLKSLPVSGPSLFTALEDVGLKLEETRATLEVWVIEHVEKPSEN